MLSMLRRVLGPRRKTILVAWELGGGTGHVQRLLSIVRELAAHDFRFVLALRKRGGAEIVARLLPQASILEAPIWYPDPTIPAVNQGLVCNYPDILFRCGYDSPESLGPLVQGWHQLFWSASPALVLCDHSPTAVLAAAGRVPVVHTGTGFTAPPSGQPFLTLHRAAALGAQEREALVLRSIQEVQSNLGAPVLNRVCDLWNSAESIACTWPELDPYASIRGEPAPGPVEARPEPQPVVKNAAVFGYLAGEEPRVPGLLKSLAKAKVRCGIYVRNQTAECMAAAAGSTVQLYDAPQKLPGALVNASAFLHHGGSTANAALALGRPQFVAPRNLDQILIGEAVQKLGCGMTLDGLTADPGEAIRRVLLRGTYDKNVAAVAARIAARPNVDVAKMIAQSCLKLLA